MQHTMAAAAAVQHLAVIHQQHCASPAGISAQGKLQLVPVSQVPAHQQAPKPAAGQVDPLPPDPYNCFTSRQLQILADHGISTADLQAMLLTAAQHPQAASSTAQAGAAAQTNVLQAKAHGSSSSYMQAPAGTGMDSSAQPLRPGACMNNMQGDCHVHVALATAQPAAAAPRKVQPMQKQAWLPASEVDALGALQGSGTLAELPMRQRPAGPHAAALAAMFLQSISTAAQAALNSRSRESTQNYKSAQHTASSQQLDLDLTLLNNNNSDINSSDDIDSPMSVMALQAYQAILNMAAQQAPLPDQVSTPPAGKPPAGPSNTKKRSQPSPSPGYDAGAAATVAGWDHMQYDASLQQGQGAATAKSGSTAYPARRKVVKKSQTGSVGDAGASPTGKSPAGQPESIFPPTERWMREVRENIPVEMQEIIRADWLAKDPKELDATCNGISAVFFVDPVTQRCKIRTQDGRDITPNEFEAECGLQNSKAWMQSILVTEYALVVHGYSHYSGGLYTKKNLCLGHFTRIVNINTSGGNSRLKR